MAIGRVGEGRSGTLNGYYPANGASTTYACSSTLPNELQSVTTQGSTPTYYSYDQNGDTWNITSTGTISTALRYDTQARLRTVTLLDGTTIMLVRSGTGLVLGERARVRPQPQALAAT